MDPLQRYHHTDPGMEIVLSNLSVPIFNAVKYALVTFIFQPAIEAQYRFATLESAQLRNGQQRVIRWRESNLASLTLHGKWYNTKSRALLILAGAFLAILSLLGEYGFDWVAQDKVEATDLWKLRPVELLDVGQATCLKHKGSFRTRCYGFWGQDTGCVLRRGNLSLLECINKRGLVERTRRVAPILHERTGHFVQ